MNLHPSLHKTLLAGLSRAPLEAGAGAAPALQPLLSGTDAEARVWHTLATEDLWQRAGFQPAQAAAIAPCASEPTCPRAAEQVLQLILRDIHPELLDHWLDLAQTMGFVLPHASLAPLLDKGLTRPALRAALVPLLGKRGQWLAAQHQPWSSAYGAAGAPEDTPAIHWQLGNLEQRREALVGMRRADPLAALAAVEQEWPQEPAENRSALLPCLATGLSLHDEAFLECALDDKRKEVRLAAQQLLASLPGSQLGERCKARLSALFTFERNTGRGLAVQLPEACDKAMLRDGIGIQKYHGLGDKAGWLQDLMRCVPPTHWSGSWDLSPKQVIDVFAATEFNKALITGLVQAAGNAIRASAGDTAIAWFVTLISDNSAARTGVDITPMLLPDLDNLPQQQQQDIVTHWLDTASDSQAYAYALAWAEQRRSPLPPAMSRLLLASSQRVMALGQLSHSTRGNFKILGRVLDAGELDYARQHWPAEGWEHWPQWRPLVDELMETLQFRHTMQRSFLEKNA